MSDELQYIMEHQTITDLKKYMTSIKDTIAHGVVDDTNPVKTLRNNRDVLEDIFGMVEKSQYDKFYEKHIVKDDVAYMTWPRVGSVRPITFPPPRDININMMPVLVGRSIFDSLPEFCKHYTNFIWEHCLAPNWYQRIEDGTLKYRVGYLTIHEGLVPVGQAQRRPGLHIERPRGIRCYGKWNERNSPAYAGLAWGLGRWNEDGLPEDGLYMASTSDESCAIWPVLIDNPEGVSDKHGGIERMRHLLGEPYKLRANEMCWFTDRTPHESLPLQAPKDDPNAKFVYRQFFRLVVGPISVWYSKHNTPNPLGIKPNAPISDENKFECETV